MTYLILWLRFLLLLPFLSVNNFQVTLSLSFSNSSIHLCHYEESTALLRFVRDFAIDHTYIWDDCPISLTGYPNINSWKGNTDCCSWDGIFCDFSSGHVIKLDLSCGRISGIIDSNSSLFQLQQLQSLNLAFNDFHNSTISPNIGKFSHLRYLNLSITGFIGTVPTEIANLSQLISLDLTTDPSNGLKLSDLSLITKSMTKLTQLDLSDILIINPVVPPSLAKLTSLSSLTLWNSGLQGNFPLAEILQFPHLRNLEIIDTNLHNSDISRINWTGFLEVLHLSSPNFTGKLPQSPGPANFLRELNLIDSNFYGCIPPWVWNTTTEINLSYNQFSGELPSILNTSKLSKIDFISLSSNNLSGEIPPWLFTLPSLSTLMLDRNRFSGKLVIEDVNPSPSLRSLVLHMNMLSGSIPMSISMLQSLEELFLNSNKFNGTVEFSVFYKLPNLTTLALSNNSLSLSFNDVDTPTQPPKFRYLLLSSCNLRKFPDFLIGQDNLVQLDLSKNNIHGQIPPWFLEFFSGYSLDLSHNYLSGGLENLRWEYLRDIFLNNNMFEGLLPQLSPFVNSFSVSNNGLTGEINSTVCKLTELVILDLSNNSLSGHIPRCLGNLSDQLIALNLRFNNFQGTLPPNFTNCGNLEIMNLNSNQFEGHVPPSLSSCLSLKFLDLGNNMLSGTFPRGLGNLTELEVLVLHSNRFEGPLIIEQDVESPFPKLRILDIANNRISGNLPHKLIMSLKAMMNRGEGDTLQYMGNYFIGVVSGFDYMYSIELTIKGSNRNFDKVLSVLVAIDVSSNMFQGDIPTAIGDLLSLRGLNLSHNNFSGVIPSSLSNLVKLEALDISSNELLGQIPKDLGSLTSLEFFNASRNKLVGPIPVGNQFNTFGSDSFLDNAGLCGMQLSNTCGDEGDAATEPPPTVYNDFEDIISIWEMVLMGYGCGIVLGLVIGCFVFLVRTPFWVSRLIYRVEYLMEQHSKRRRRRRLA